MRENIIFRNYCTCSGITEDYYAVRTFLIKRGYCAFTYARWDWMTTHSCLEKESISKIGLWQDNGEIVAIATFDCQPGQTFLIALPEYSFLMEEMLEYAVRTFGENENFSIVIPDTDMDSQLVLAKKGFAATPEKESDAIFYPDKMSTDYTLPNGFQLTDLQNTPDLRQYERVLWKGFNHELDGDGDYDSSNEDGSQTKGEIFRPNVDLYLKIAAVAPDGQFAAYCGMWYDKESEYGVIEPVATDPSYRRMGLGKAVVLEGIKRVYAQGAKYVVVGSSQQFYYSIGLMPYSTNTIWKPLRAK